jgi:hypothetical protein
MFPSLGNFVKFTRLAQILGKNFNWKSCAIKFCKKRFGWFFHKSIWSPCSYIRFFTSLDRKLGLLKCSFLTCEQGCQMVCFQTKNWVNLGGSCDWKSWHNYWPFGLFYGHWKYFMAIWYILWSFGIFVPVLVSCTKKNLATLLASCKLCILLTKRWFNKRVFPRYCVYDFSL